MIWVRSFVNFLISDSSSDHTCKKKSLANTFMWIISVYSYNATEIKYQLLIIGSRDLLPKAHGAFLEWSKHSDCDCGVITYLHILFKGLSNCPFKTSKFYFIDYTLISQLFKCFVLLFCWWVKGILICLISELDLYNSTRAGQIIYACSMVMAVLDESKQSFNNTCHLLSKYTANILKWWAPSVQYTIGKK